MAVPRFFASIQPPIPQYQCSGLNKEPREAVRSRKKDPAPGKPGTAGAARGSAYKKNEGMTFVTCWAPLFDCSRQTVDMADEEAANAGLEKVTDYHDEKELNADDTADALSSLATPALQPRYRVRHTAVPV